MSTPSQYLTSRPLPLRSSGLNLATPDPMFGYNPFAPAGSNMYLASDPYPDYSVVMAQRTQIQQSLFAQAAQMRAAAAITGANIADLTPNQWTPQEAVDQTSVALSKIATVNPELAQQLAAKRAAAPAQDKGFIGDLFATLSEAGHAVAFGFGKGLELVAASSYIVPNIVHDLVDGGGVDLTADFFGGVTGARKHNWNSVLQELGWKGDGFPGFLRAGVGLVGDVVTDPLTWALMGANVGSTAGSKLLGKTAVLESASIREAAEKATGRGGAELTKWLEQIIGTFDGSTMKSVNRLAKYGSADLAERMAAQGAIMYNEAQERVLSMMFETYNHVFRQSRIGAIGRLLKQGEIKLSDGTVVKVGRDVFETVVRAGTGAAASSTEAAAAREMARALPGLRVRLAVPLSSMRYISPVLPGMKWVGGTFNLVRKTFAGQAGMERLLVLIENGIDGATMDALDHYMVNGWESFALKYDKLAGRLKGWNNLGGGLYRMSEQLGKATAAMSDANRAARQGLMYYLDYEERRAITEQQRRLISQGLEGLNQEGRKTTRREFINKGIAIGIHPKPSKTTLSAEARRDMWRYLEFVPDDLIDEPADRLAAELTARLVQPEEAKLLAMRTEGATADAVAAAQTRVDRAKRIVDTAVELTATVPEAHKSYINDVRAMQTFIHNEVGKSGYGLGNVKSNFATAPFAPSSQIDEFQYGTEGKLFPNPNRKTGWVTHPSVGANAEGTLQGGAGQFAQPTAYGHGVVVDFAPVGGVSTAGATEVTFRAKRTLIIDPLGENSENVRIIEDIVRKVEEAGDLSYEVITQMQKNGLPAGGILDELAQNEKLSKFVNLALSAEGYDSIAYYDGNAISRVIVLNPKDVLVINDAANYVRQVRGYAPRILTPELRQWIRGVITGSERSLVWSAPDVERRLERNTVDMTWDEAVEYIRNYVKTGDEFAHIPADRKAVLDDMDILDFDPLRAHIQYVNSMSVHLASGLVDDFMRRLTNLARIAPSLFSNAPRADRYEILVDPRLVKLLGTLDKKLGPTVEKLAVRTGRFLEAEQKAAIELAERHEDFVTSLTHALGLGEPMQSRHVVALRRWAQLYGNVGKYIADAQRDIRSRMRGLRKEEQLWDRVMQKAAALPVEMVDGTQVPGHVARDADVRVTLLDAAENIYQVDGYHAAVPSTLPGRAVLDPRTGEIFTTPDQIIGGSVREQVAAATATGNFDHYNGGALHFGSYGAARDRGLDRMMWLRDMEEEIGGDTDLLLGTRAAGETDFPIYAVRVEMEDGFTEEVYVESLKNRWMSEEGGRLDRRRTEAEFAQAVNERVFEVTGETPKRIISKNVADPDALNEMGLDVMYVEDFIYPVTYRGKLALDPNILPSEDDINPVFGAFVRNHRTGKPYSSEEWIQTEVSRGRPLEELQAMDDMNWFDPPEVWRERGVGALPYRNTVEGSGADMSLAVFLPQNLEQPTIYTKIEEMARLGQLHLDDATDSFLNLRGNFRKGGRALRVRHGDDIAEERATLIEQLDFLKQAQAEMDSARGKGASAMNAILDENQLYDAAAKAGTTLGNVIEKYGTREATLARKLARLQDATSRAMKEMNSLYAEAQGAVAKMKPAFVKVDALRGDMTGLVPLTVPGMRGWAAPATIAHEMNRLFETTTLSDARKAWRQFLVGPWKRWATFRWMGFHVRNTMGAWFNNFLGGVTHTDYEFALKLRGNSKSYTKPVEDAEWARMRLDILFPERLKGKLTYEDIATVLADDGILGASTAAVYATRSGVDVLEEEMGLPKKAVGRARELAGGYDRIMRGIGDTVEQFFRTAAWSRGMSATGGDRLAARSWVMMRHGDYSDLTDFEDKLRDVVPFYKWIRTNVPYQLRMMLEAPGVYTAATQKSEVFFAEAQGVDWEEAKLQMPEWMKESYTIPYPESIQKLTDRVPGFNLLFGQGAERNEGMKFIMFDLPYKDLYMGLTDYVSAGLPVIRNILESYVYKQQTFSGRKLNGNFIRASDWMSYFLPAFAALGKTLGMDVARKGADGTWYIQDKFDNVLTGWPIYSKFRNWVLDSPEENRYVQRMTLLTSSLLGFSIRPADYTAAELDFYYSQVQPVLDQYRSLGVQFPTAEDFQSPEVGSLLGQFSNQLTPSYSKEGSLTGFRQS